MTILSDKYAALGGAKLGKQISPETYTKDRKGRYLELEQVINGTTDKITIYLHPNPKIGAHLIRGLIRKEWLQAGGLNGLGYPLTDEEDTEDERGRYNDFQKGSIYFRKGASEAFIIRGPIREKWLKEDGVIGLGYPTTDETSIEDGKGRYNDFRSANDDETDWRSIYYHPKTGAHI